MKKLFLMIFLLFLASPELSPAVANKPVVSEADTVSYYSTIKLLRSRALRENQKMGTVFFGPHQTLWQKIKKELVDKELRHKAFIKENELVVSHQVLEDLEAKVTVRTKELVQAQGKKQDRMISVGYAESRVRDMLRRAGYRDAKEIKTIMSNVAKSIKHATKNKRIALSKLEELTFAAMQRNKENQKHYANKKLSRLGAEVKMLTAIKHKKLSAAQEITATEMMTDALNKQKTRRFSTKFIDELIATSFKTIENNERKKPEKAKPVKKQKTSKKAAQKRGKPYGRGRWGLEKRPISKTTLG